MITTTQSRRYDEAPADLARQLRTMLSADRTAQASWAPDERKVCVSFDNRNTADRLLDMHFHPKILEVTLSEDGTVAVDFAATQRNLTEFSSEVADKFVRDFFCKLEAALRED